MTPDYADSFSLYSSSGNRKYLNGAERSRVLTAIAELAPDRALYALVLAWAGARVTEVLRLTPASFQIERGIVAIVTLKRRRLCIREVPLPPELIDAIESHFGLSAMQRDPLRADHRLWPWHRVTAWRIVKELMRTAQVVGRQACPRGLRHAFGVGVLQAGVPLSLLQKWLGHSRICTTAIYAAVCGPEEVAFAGRFWTLQSGLPEGEHTLLNILRVAHRHEKTNARANQRADAQHS